MKCSKCNKEMGCYDVEFDADNGIFLDLFECYFCGFQDKVESEDCEEYEDPYNEVERRNCHNLILS
jgi:hypothetical protein